MFRSVISQFMNIVLPVVAILAVNDSPAAATLSGSLPANDDGSTGLISLGFDFTLFGNTYSSLYINNNGNLTFSGPLSTFTPNAFPSVGPAMIAPFWADVDTRSGKGAVSYAGNAGSFTVNWTNVGYYNATSETNTNARDNFSVTVQKNNGIIFQYGPMTWTTGDASSGTNGLGGAPATLGLNAGDGVESVIFRQYNSAAVSALNGTKWYFQTDNATLPTPSFKQSTTPWGGLTTLNGTHTMQQTGCFVTSTAMVLNSLGHNTDPGKLDNYLTPYMAGGTLNFTTIPQSLFYGQTDDVPGPPCSFP